MARNPRVSSCFVSQLAANFDDMSRSSASLCRPSNSRSERGGSTGGSSFLGCCSSFFSSSIHHLRYEQLLRASVEELVERFGHEARLRSDELLGSSANRTSDCVAGLVFQHVLALKDDATRTVEQMPHRVQLHLLLLRTNRLHLGNS